MSQMCSLSTSAVRDSVSTRVPPTQPTPMAPTSTVFTLASLSLNFVTHKDHAGAGPATSPRSFRGAAKRRTRNPGAHDVWLWIPGSRAMRVPRNDVEHLRARLDAKHPRGALRIDLRQFRRDHLAHQPQVLGRGRRRYRHVGRPVELEAGVDDHLGE